MIEKSALFCLGALGYGCIELAWRGRTHWTMLLAGGLCMLALWALNERLGRWPLLARCAAGALVITGVELAFGVVCNLALGWRVWDYSLLWGNLWGQICPLYSSLWFLLCIPIFGSLSHCRARLDAPAAPGGSQEG